MDGRKVSVFYNDTAGSVSRLDGTLLEFTKLFIKIIPCNTDKEVIILNEKIVRIEYVERSELK